MDQIDIEFQQLVEDYEAEHLIYPTGFEAEPDFEEDPIYDVAWGRQEAGL
ncbi:hypothetical protein [Mycetocola zhujimingii]|nr:hypothetical protein [Mycetocola zhujimingii]